MLPSCEGEVRGVSVEEEVRRRCHLSGHCHTTAQLSKVSARRMVLFSGARPFNFLFFGGLFFSGYFGKIWLFFLVFCSVMKGFFEEGGAFCWDILASGFFLYFMYGIFFMFGYLFMRMIFRRV